MKNKFVIVGALALSLVTGGLTAFAADTTVNAAPAAVTVTNVAATAPAAKPAMKKISKRSAKAPAKKAMPATAKKIINKKKAVKTTTAAPASVPTTPATN